MHKELESGKRVRLLPLKDVALQDKYPEVDPNKGKEGNIEFCRPTGTGPIPSPPIEPTTKDMEYKIKLDDGTIIIAPHEALELLD